MPPRRVSLGVFVALLFAFLALFLLIAAPFLLAVFLGQLLALMLEPLQKKLARRVPRSLAALLLTAAVIAVLFGPVAILGTLAARQAENLADQLAGRDVFSREHIMTLLKPLEPVLGDSAKMRERVGPALESSAKTLSVGLLGAARRLPRLMLQLFITVVSCFFLLKDEGRFIDRLSRMLPVEEDVRRSLVATFRATTVSTVWASLAGASLHATVIAVAFLAFGIPMVALAAAAAFILGWVPVIGSAPVGLAGALYLLHEGRVGAVAGGCAIGVATAVADHLLRPRLLRGRARMHTLVGLLAILGGVSAWGAPGLFIGPVLAALLFALLELWPAVAKRHGLELGDLSS